jgi:hypothetical protein
MFTYSKAVVALGLEVAGLWMLLAYHSHSLVLLGYFTAHLGASALAALVLTRVLPGHIGTNARTQPAWALGYLFVMCFFIPVIGVFGLLTAAQIGRFKRKPGHSEAFRTLEEPEFAPVSTEVRQIKGKAQARAQLSNPGASVETRLRSLLAMQDLPSRVANPIIRDMLADPSDDVRLVAYGILDSREKSINHRIHALRGRLVEGGGPDARLAAERQLAELYWELIYQGLVQGDLRRHAAEQAWVHLEVALGLAPEDPVLWALRGRLEILAGRYLQARGAFARAAAFGLPEVRVLPYLAEIAFHVRDYARVRALLARIAEASQTQRMSQVIEYWGRDAASAR